MLVGLRESPVRRTLGHRNETEPRTKPNNHVTQDRKATNLFLALLADDLEHGLGVRRLLESLAEIGFVKEFGNIGEGMQVLLKLALRHEEQYNQVDRLVIQRVELHARA